MHKKEFRQLVCAILLGDGYLSNSDRERHTRSELRIEHSGAQEDFLRWKISLLDDVLTKRKRNRQCRIYSRERFDRRTGKHYSNRLAVLSWRRYFRILRSRVYNKPNTRFYKNVEFLLNNISTDRHLAIWLMDDACECRSRARHKDGTVYWKNPYFVLGICSFTEGQAELAKQWFTQRYGVTPKLHIRKNGQPILQFGVKETKLLFPHIRPYVVQLASMRTKFRLCLERY